MAMTSGLKPKLFCAWFCPFAQRAWIAINQNGTEYEYCEQDPYDKTPEWLAVNPRGLVPAIVHNGHSIVESPICIEYIDEAFPNGNRLLPNDPLERAHVRMWSDFVSKKIVPLYYAMLLKKTSEEREQAKVSLTQNLAVFNGDIKGPFFEGNRMGMVDVMVYPYLLRLDVLKHFREYDVSKEDPRFSKIWKLRESMEEASSVKSTLPDMQKLIQSYQRYADDTAKTEVADAIRKGTALP